MVARREGGLDRGDLHRGDGQVIAASQRQCNQVVTAMLGDHLADRQDMYVVDVLVHDDPTTVPDDTKRHHTDKHGRVGNVVRDLPELDGADVPVRFDDLRHDLMVVSGVDDGRLPSLLRCLLRCVGRHGGFFSSSDWSDSNILN